MRKGYIIAIAIALLLLLGIVFAVFTNNRDNTLDSNMIEDKQLAEGQDINNSTVNTVETSSAENDNILPSASIIKKTYYKGCDHLIREIEDVDVELVNKNEEEVKEKYPDWELQGYSREEIVLYKEVEGFCNEHYVLKVHNGVIGIYTVDQNGNKTLKQDTEIQIQYLPEIDIENLKKGIYVIGDEALNSALEDYE